MAHPTSTITRMKLKELLAADQQASPEVFLISKPCVFAPVLKKAEFGKPCVFFKRLRLGCRPACTHEGNLVDELCEIAHDVEQSLVDCDGGSPGACRALLQGFKVHPANPWDVPHAVVDRGEEQGAEVIPSMYVQPTMPRKKPTHAWKKPVPPAHPKASIATVPRKSLQKHSEVTGFCAALTSSPNSILCGGTGKFHSPCL